MTKRNVLLLLGIALLLGASSATATSVSFQPLPGGGPQAVPDFALDLSIDGFTPVGLVNGQFSGVFAVIDAAEGIFSFSGVAFFQKGNDTESLVRIQYEYTVDPDPLVTVAMAMTTGNSAAALVATANAAIAPNLYNAFAGSYSGSATDNRNDGVTASGILMTVDIPNGSQVGTIPTSGIPQACAFGPNPNPGPTSYVCAGDSTNGKVYFAPVSTNTATVALGLTGSARDTFTFNGGVDIFAAPEPSTTALLGVGLMALAGISRRLARKK